MVLPAIEAEPAILSELRAELVALLSEGTESLILFGSYATGEQDEASDIDLFGLVANDCRKQDLEERAARALNHFNEIYSSPLSLIVYTRAEAREHLQPGQSPFRTELESTGIILHGLGIGEWGIDGPQDEDATGVEKRRAAPADKS
jgi:predicted nucleotidyltransferase